VRHQHTPRIIDYTIRETTDYASRALSGILTGKPLRSARTSVFASPIPDRAHRTGTRPVSQARYDMRDCATAFR